MDNQKIKFMNILSISSKQKLFLIFLVISFSFFAWVIQIIFIGKLRLAHVCANLPLTIIIVTGLVANFNYPKENPNEIKRISLGQVVKNQFKNGSISGLFLGLFLASIEKSLTGVLPIAYPLVGFLAGYFSLGNFSLPVFLIIPLVFMFSVLAQAIFSLELFFLHVNGVFNHLINFAMIEASINALIAPFVYFPINAIYEYWINMEK